jgi:ZU5 domain
MGSCIRRLYVVGGVLGALALGVACSSGGNGASPGSGEDAGGADATGGGKDSGTVDAAATVQKRIGPKGGSLTTQSGSGVTIPEGALTQDVTISVASAPKAPPVPSTLGKSAGEILLFSPEGQKFQKPVTVTLAVSAGSLPRGATEQDVVIATSEESPVKYSTLQTTVKDSKHVQADTTHFSYFAAIVPASSEESDAAPEDAEPSDAELPDAEPSDASCTPDANLGTCNCVDLKQVTASFSCGSLPTPAGGTIVDGTYVQTSVLQTNAPCVENGPRVLTLVIAGSSWQGALGGPDGGVGSVNVTATTNGNEVVWDWSCWTPGIGVPDGGVESFEYSATPTTLQLITPGGDNPSVLTFTKQTDGGAP